MKKNEIIARIEEMEEILECLESEYLLIIDELNEYANNLYIKNDVKTVSTNIENISEILKEILNYSLYIESATLELNKAKTQLEGGV